MQHHFLVLVSFYSHLKTKPSEFGLFQDVFHHLNSDSGHHVTLRQGNRSTKATEATRASHGDIGTESENWSTKAGAKNHMDRIVQTDLF